MGIGMKRYLINPTDYALVVTREGLIKLYIPASEPADYTVPEQVKALIVIGNKLCDDQWVSSLLDEEYFDEAILMDQRGSA